MWARVIVSMTGEGESERKKASPKSSHECNSTEEAGGVLEYTPLLEGSNNVFEGAECTSVGDCNDDSVSDRLAVPPLGG